MNNYIIRNLSILICLILVQVLICNHIMIFNAAMVFIFIYTIISLPMNLSTNLLLTIAFLAGFVVDIFSDTLGINAMACTLLAMSKKNVLFLYVPKDDRTKDIIPSNSSLGFGVYGKYLFTLTALYSLIVFSIEYMNLGDIVDILKLSAGTSVLSFLVLLGIDCLVNNGKNT